MQSVKNKKKHKSKCYKLILNNRKWGERSTFIAFEHMNAVFVVDYIEFFQNNFSIGKKNKYLWKHILNYL